MVLARVGVEVAEGVDEPVVVEQCVVEVVFERGEEVVVRLAEPWLSFPADSVLATQTYLVCFGG